MERLMAVQAKMDLVEPPIENDGITRFQGLYKGQDFVADVTGLHLNKELANYRARLVGREIAKEKRDDLYAATPPLESQRVLLSLCASSQK